MTGMREGRVAVWQWSLTLVNRLWAGFKRNLSNSSKHQNKTPKPRGLENVPSSGNMFHSIMCSYKAWKPNDLTISVNEMDMNFADGASEILPWRKTQST